MSYYYRYTMSDNQIENDIQRGYSFRYYDLHSSVRELVENSAFIEYEAGYFNSISDLDLDEMNDDEILEALEDAGIDCRQDLPGSGKWGLAYNGLSAFGPFETVEEAKSQALLWHYNGFDGQVFTHVAVVEGEPTGCVDDNDMDTIRVNEIIEVIAR
jgi:hypothetical protein